jgi:hypothetical protein
VSEAMARYYEGAEEAREHLRELEQTSP